MNRDGFSKIVKIGMFYGFLIAAGYAAPWLKAHYADMEDIWKSLGGTDRVMSSDEKIQEGRARLEIPNIRQASRRGWPPPSIHPVSQSSAKQALTRENLKG
jgi:hypothetical protein